MRAALRRCVHPVRRCVQVQRRRACEEREGTGRTDNATPRIDRGELAIAAAGAMLLLHTSALPPASTGASCPHILQPHGRLKGGRSGLVPDEAAIWTDRERSGSDQTRPGQRAGFCGPDRPCFGSVWTNRLVSRAASREEGRA